MATTITPYVPPHPAIMRNAHEVVRAAVTELTSLTAGDGALFRDLHKYVNLHMIMEEGTDGTSGFFAYLDKVSAAAGGAPSQAAFRAEHVADGAGAQRVLDAVAAGGAAGIREAWGAYAKETEHHLLHEESIMTDRTNAAGGHPGAGAARPRGGRSTSILTRNNFRTATTTQLAQHSPWHPRTT